MEAEAKRDGPRLATGPLFSYLGYNKSMAKNKILAKLNPLFFSGIAHRGLWNSELTENGLKAFQNAIDHHLAFEYDIHLTKDGQLLVCHDDNLKRTTGKEGIIEELTLAEIKANYRLLDGEEVPTFQELLALNHEQVPMICELKIHEANYKPLAKAAMAVFKKEIKDKKNLWVISFDPRALLRIHGYVRGLLVCKEHLWTLKLRNLYESLDMEDTLVAEPRVVCYRKKHPVNTWTIEKSEQIVAVRPFVDTMTFQKLAPEEIHKALP